MHMYLSWFDIIYMVYVAFSQMHILLQTGAYLHLRTVGKSGTLVGVVVYIWLLWTVACSLMRMFPMVV